jgi:hypothetical protein
MVFKTSKLSELKSVFNSAEDNLHYFRLLKNSVGLSFGSVQLAEPVLQHSTQTVTWKTPLNGSSIPFPELSPSEQLEVGRKVQEAFLLFHNKIGAYKNITQEFKAKILEIPGQESILLVRSDEEEKIVITEWGFWADKLDRKEGVLQSIFPPPDFSILARVYSPSGIPVQNEAVVLMGEGVQRMDVSDSNGLVRLGALSRGRSFTLQSPVSNFPPISFVCDGRPEYRIEIPRQVNLTVKVRTSSFDPVPDFAFAFISPSGEKSLHSTNIRGVSQFTTSESTGEIYLLDTSGTQLYKGQLSTGSMEVELVVDPSPPIVPEEIIPEPPLPEPEPLPLELQFLNWRNRPIQNKAIQVTSALNGVSHVLTTNDTGSVFIKDLPPNYQYDVSLHHGKLNWKFQFLHEAGIPKHTFKLRYLWPWLWWLLIAVLLFLLWLCWSGYFCELLNPLTAAMPVADEAMNSPNPDAIPCNQVTESGGQEISVKNHTVGNKSGVVSIFYNNQRIPDKIEVFYESVLMASTYDALDNRDGFVHGKGVLEFNYQPNNSQDIVVKVSGTEEGTNWEYTVNCPN